jgi:hypothetical protein
MRRKHWFLLAPLLAAFVVGVVAEQYIDVYWAADLL